MLHFLVCNLALVTRTRAWPNMRRALQQVEDADGLLVVGSSLMVYSAFRLAKAAKDGGAQLAAVCVGVTRADDFINLKVRPNSDGRDWNAFPTIPAGQNSNTRCTPPYLPRQRRWSLLLAKPCHVLHRIQRCCCHERGDALHPADLLICLRPVLSSADWQNE
jgi:hypothetical protein